ncbi:MAG: methyltransferase domain-containing protein [Lachnospiraceae bacterium]|nr:methyltransferase domain-containing protein [Lachnospiraceae bacterium]
MKLPGYYTSGEFAKMAHISVRTIRFYDKQNILKPSYVNASGARFYSEADFARLQQILLLKYLGFSLEDIRNMTVGDADYHMLRNSLQLQLKLVQDRMEQMQLVAKAIQDTTEAIDNEQEINWSQMLNLIHLTNMESSLKSQYQNASNISARIRLHKLYATNPQGWFPWIYEHCGITQDMDILELGCGNGSLWKENYDRLPSGLHIILNDISEGMLRDTRRDMGHLAYENPVRPVEAQEAPSIDGMEEVDRNNRPVFAFHAFDCHQIPYPEERFDLVIANHVLFYCEELPSVLEEVRRVLKPGGVFVCSTYGSGHMKEITELVQAFNSLITLSADHLYERFGLENGAALLVSYFSGVHMERYEDCLVVDQPEPLIEYILSCHGNQNQYILDRYKDFRTFVERKIKKGFTITKQAGLFLCTR